MPLVVRWKTAAGATSATAVCGSAWASDTTVPSFTSRSALATFSGVMRLVVPFDSCPTGAHLPQVLNSVRHLSYWARSAAVSGGADGGACAAARPNICNTVPPIRPAMTKPAHAATDARRLRMRPSTAFRRPQTGIAILAGDPDKSSQFIDAPLRLPTRGTPVAALFADQKSGLFATGMW